MELEVGELVLCVVDRIVGTNVFVRIPEAKNAEASIVTSEIAAGRIRNLRDYVVPKKKIVCKVLRVDRGHIELTLRRVSQKETKEVLAQHQQESSAQNILKSTLKEKAENIINEILKEEKVSDFLEESKKDSKKLEALVGKEAASKILEILNSEKQKKAILKKEIELKSNKPDGITLAKEILSKIENAEVKYISAGNYSIKVESEDLKKAGQKLQEIINQIEKSAKQHGLEFSDNSRK